MEELSSRKLKYNRGNVLIFDKVKEEEYSVNSDVEKIADHRAIGSRKFLW